MRILLALLFLLAGCGSADDPETQVRKTIDAIEAAAEARDVDDVMEHVSDQFRDAYGRDARALSRYLRGYFIANQSIHLLTRIRGIEFPTAEEARVQVTVGMLGRHAEDSWDLAAEIREFHVTLMHQYGAWKVTYVRVAPSGGTFDR
jgi:hypothetical protein